MKRLTLVLLLLAVSGLASCSLLQDLPILGPAFAGSKGYRMISVAELESLKDSDEEFTLVNVHIPLEGNITNTDLEIPYNDVESYLGQLPADKDANIVIYCRSGSMGDEASQTLAGLGYSNVSNLEGGYIAWKAYGLPFEE